MRFLRISDASKEIGLCQATLRKWVDQDRIPHRRTPGGQRLIDVDAYLAGESKLEPQKDESNRDRIFYCRVSSKKQTDDLQRQVELAENLYPDHEVIKDVGSGINWKRRGFQSLLARVQRGEVEEVVVFHRDRIARIGYDLIESVFRNSGTEIKIHRSAHSVAKQKSSEEELAEDLMSIITVFSCKQMGKRRYKIGKSTVEMHEDLSESGTEKCPQEMD